MTDVTKIVVMPPNTHTHTHFNGLNIIISVAIVYYLQH